MVTHRSEEFFEFCEELNARATWFSTRSGFVFGYKNKKAVFVGDSPEGPVAAVQMDDGTWTIWALSADDIRHGFITHGFGATISLEVTGFSVGLTESQLDDIFQLMDQGKTISAIKKLREVAYCGLREAKDMVEYIHNLYKDHHAPRPYGTNPCNEIDMGPAW